MIYELQYTSAPRGLLPGSSGYTTVKATAGLPPPLRTALESLSIYRRVFPPGHAQAALSPVAWSQTRMNVAGRTWHVLSRTCDAGFDHTHRSNYFTHHIAVSADSLPQGGPAWLLSQPGLLATAWDGTVEEPASAVRLPSGNDTARVCSRWRELTGDAGWAGVVASHLARRSGPVVVAFSLGTDLLSLFAQALALLPGSSRWDITFTTYYQGASGSEPYRLRGVLSGSPEHKEATRLPQALVIDLGSPLGEPPADELVEFARTGRRLSPAVSVTFESVPDDQHDEGATSYGLQSRAQTAAEEPASARRPPPLTSHLPMSAPLSSGSIPWPISFGGGLVSGIVATVCIALALRLTEPPEATKSPVAKATPPAQADQLNGAVLAGNNSEENREGDRQPDGKTPPDVIAASDKSESGKADDRTPATQKVTPDGLAAIENVEALEGVNRTLKSENDQLKQDAKERTRQDEQKERQATERATAKAEQQLRLASLVEVDDYAVFTKDSNYTDVKLETIDWPDDVTGKVDLLGRPNDHLWESQDGQSWALLNSKKDKLLTLQPDRSDPKPFPRKWKLLVEPKRDSPEMMPLRRTVLKFHPAMGKTRHIALREKPPAEFQPNLSTRPMVLSREQRKCEYQLNSKLGKERVILESDKVLLRDLQIETLTRARYPQDSGFRGPNVDVEWRFEPEKGHLLFTLQDHDLGDELAGLEFRIRGFRVSLIVEGVLVVRLS